MCLAGIFFNSIGFLVYVRRGRKNIFKDSQQATFRINYLQLIEVEEFHNGSVAKYLNLCDCMCCTANLSLY